MHYQRLLLAALVSAPISTALAAPIQWATPFEVVSSSDLKVSGRDVVYAVNGGDNKPLAGNLDIVSNGKTVSFEGLSVLYGAGSTFNQTTYGDLQSHRFGAGNKVTFDVFSERGTNVPLASFDPGQGLRTVYTPSTGDNALDSLLNSQVSTDGRFLSTNATPSLFKISLNQLIPGTTYHIQLIAGADSRPGTNQRSDSRFIASDAQPTPSLTSGLDAYSDLDADGTRHVTSVIGEFTADTASQRIDILLGNGRNPGISGLILTTTSAIPEPAGLTFLLLPAAGLLARKSR